MVSSFAPNIKPVFGVKVIVIDAGHGGKDPGCHGSKHNEKDIALAVALKLGKYIEDNLKDVKVVYTRSTDVFVELQERAEIANKAKADLFVSIHCNSACVRDKKLKKDICRDQVHGAETYVMGIKNEKGKLDIAKRENSAILLEDNYVKKYDGFDPNSDESYIIMSMFADTYLDQSLSFASKTQKQYSIHAARNDKGVKRASLWVLWRTYMPSVLTEIGYLTNKEEEEFLGSAKGQDYVATGLFKAFREYKDDIEGNIKKYDDAIEKKEPYKADSLAIVKEIPIQKAVKPDTISKVPVVKKEVAIKEENKTKALDEKKKTDTIAKISTISKTVIKEENKTKPVEEHKNPDLIKVPDITVKTDSKSNDPLNNTVVYKVQLLSSDKKIPFTSDKLKDVEKPGEYVDKGIFKYTAGEFLKKEDAAQLQTTLRKKGFKDAFVIAIQDGKRIALK